ncbi:hypothetical protein BDY21DRAFT_291636 [Lineolata rhizophorae]|uniref:Uncharacterized protein n=1 Tax=Lineolata rhizophorae TaxID=578093 RepID=A0A6A6NRH8_9PEZI|nr:hypothetical protein BDY21DRAFT_291636 [Lineolata rhizophorae]
MAAAATPVHPGRSIGFITLGLSLHAVLTRLKAEPQTYPKIDISYSASQPLYLPVVLTLPCNGLRLRFDGADQRLRLIEVLDFTKTKLVYKHDEIVKTPDGGTAAATTSTGGGPVGTAASPTGPNFRYVYKVFGTTFAGEYIAPASGDGEDRGTYVLSYPGLAFSFPVLHKAWAPSKDFVSLLSSSSATLPATSMAVFAGDSWPAARPSLYSKPPANPRSLALLAGGKGKAPDEVELARVHGEGRIELVRRSSPPFWLVLSETTPQDLVAELGPPDAIYRKNDRRLSIHRARGSSTAESVASSDLMPGAGTGAAGLMDDSDLSDGADGEGGPSGAAQDAREYAAAECFYNYFHHGFDIFISQPTAVSPPSPTSPRREAHLSPSPLAHLTATKILFHANVPGSYPFNRHRRSRWTLEHVPCEPYTEPLNSEMRFADISGRLREVFRGTYASDEEAALQQRGMVLNRGWGDSPGSSCELLGGWEGEADGTGQGGRRKAGGAGVGDGDGGQDDSAAGLGDSVEQGLGNTELFGFPGLVFEVLKNGAVSCLTVV